MCYNAIAGREDMAPSRVRDFIVGPATNSLFWLVPGFRALMRVVEKEKPPSVVDL